MEYHDSHNWEKVVQNDTLDFLPVDKLLTTSTDFNKSNF